jgi:hypothetical protein
MSVYATVGKMDTLGFPTGAHALVEGAEHTLCGLGGRAPGSPLYPVEGAVTCPRCLLAIEEVQAQAAALVIEEPVEVVAACPHGLDRRWCLVCTERAYCET